MQSRNLPMLPAHSYLGTNMANPQKENGHLQISNDIVDKFCKYRLSGEEWKVLWVIIRKTYGFNKKSDKISLSQFVKLTEMKRTNVIRSLKKLVNKKVIKKDTTYTTTYSLVKDYDKWEDQTSSQIETSPNRLSTSSHIDYKLVAKQIQTKDIKDTIQKTTTLQTPTSSSEENIISTNKTYLVIWNKFAEYHNLSKINTLTKPRLEKLSVRKKEKCFDFKEILGKVEKQSFMLGDNDRKWKVDFDWIIKNDDNYVKILEMKYGASEPQRKNRKL